MADDTLLVQPLAAVLEALSVDPVDCADLVLYVLAHCLHPILASHRAEVVWELNTYIRAHLVPHRAAAVSRLIFQQPSIGAVHADAVVGVEKPSTRLRIRLPRQPKAKEEDFEPHAG